MYTHNLYIILLVRHRFRFSVFRTEQNSFVLFLLFFIFFPLTTSFSIKALKRVGRINRFAPKWFNPPRGTATSVVSLVESWCNFVGLVPPDRISFGWLASIPFVSIGWKLRLTSNTLDRPTIVPCKLLKRAPKAACRGIIRPRPSNGFWRATNQRSENSVTCLAIFRLR